VAKRAAWEEFRANSNCQCCQVALE
jgi:hypothetical protein